MTATPMTGVALSTRQTRTAPRVVTPWCFALAMVGFNVVLVAGCLVLGAVVAAVVCASCAGYLAAVCRDARPERSNRGGGGLQ